MAAGSGSGYTASSYVHAYIRMYVYTRMFIHTYVYMYSETSAIHTHSIHTYVHVCGYVALNSLQHTIVSGEHVSLVHNVCTYYAHTYVRTYVHVQVALTSLQHTKASSDDVRTYVCSNYSGTCLNRTLCNLQPSLSWRCFQVLLSIFAAHPKPL